MCGWILVLKVIMPRYMTEVVMHEELAETVMESIKVMELMEVSMSEYVAHEDWCGWEECLKT